MEEVLLKSFFGTARPTAQTGDGTAQPIETAWLSGLFQLRVEIGSADSAQGAISSVCAARSNAWISTVSCCAARLASLASSASFTPGITTAA
jgi:hypothetical protein